MHTDQIGEAGLVQYVSICYYLIKQNLSQL